MNNTNTYQIHVEAANLRRLAGLETPRPVWRIVPNLHPEIGRIVFDVAIVGNCRSVTRFPNGVHGSAWLESAEDATVLVRECPDCEWVDVGCLFAGETCQHTERHAQPIGD